MEDYLWEEGNQQERSAHRHGDTTGGGTGGRAKGRRGAHGGCRGQRGTGGSPRTFKGHTEPAVLAGSIPPCTDSVLIGLRI